MSATATAPKAPPIIEELEAQKRKAATEKRDAEASQRDTFKPHIRVLMETGKASPEIHEHYQNHPSPKAACESDLQACSDAIQHFELCEQANVLSDELAELIEERRTVSKALDEAEVSLNKSNGTFNPGGTDKEQFRQHAKAKNLVSDLALEKQCLSNCIKEVEAEIATLKRAADEIVVLIDPTSKLSPPMNFAIAGGPKKSIKSPFARAESIKLREDKLAKAKREIEERETKIANHRASITELTQQLANAQATFGEDRADEINKIKTRIEFCNQQINEKATELDRWRLVEAEESRRLELEKSA